GSSGGRAAPAWGAPQRPRPAAGRPRRRAPPSARAPPARAHRFPRKMALRGGAVMDLAPWLGFLGLSTAAVLTPGPTLLAVVGHAAGTGFRATVPVVLGNALGIAVLMGISLAGVASALLRAPGLLLV